MSWYNTVVVSFSSCDFDDEHDASNQDCSALREINKWLRLEGYGPLRNMNTYKRGPLGSNAVLFGGCYNYLDIGAFAAHVFSREWGYPEDVQILFWDDNASRFSVITPRIQKRGARSNAQSKKPRKKDREH